MPGRRRPGRGNATSPSSARSTTTTPLWPPSATPASPSLVGPSVTFKALWEVDVKPPAPVLMKASTGAPLLCEKTVGKGRVLLFTSSCDRSWTNFPIRPAAYLPWTHQLAAYLTQEPLNRDTFHLTGDVVEVTPSRRRAVGAAAGRRSRTGEYAAAHWNDDDAGDGVRRDGTCPASTPSRRRTARPSACSPSIRRITSRN